VSPSWGSESDTEPQTPPRPAVIQPVIRPVFAKSHVIPDFVQIIRRIRLPRSVPPVIERERVILFTGIKPKRLQKKHLFASVTTQIKRQALHAFLGDSTLKTIGAIVAFGAIWKYVEFPRPVGSTPSNWSEHMDPTFGSRPNESYIVFRVPTFLKELSGNKDMSFWPDGSSRKIGGSTRIPHGQDFATRKGYLNRNGIHRFICTVEALLHILKSY
jgi:hypothetical protein